MHVRKFDRHIDYRARILKPGKFWRWLLVLVLSLSFREVIAATEVPILHAHVNDYAEVLGQRADRINNKLVAFEKATGHQVYVLMVKTIGLDHTIEEYALDVFNSWKLGHKGIDDGVLLVVAVDDRKLRIEVGYGLEGTLTDVISSRIIRNVMKPRFKEGDIAGGTESGVDALLEVLQSDAGPRFQDTKADNSVPLPAKIILGTMALVGGLIFMWMSVSLGGILGFLLMSGWFVGLPFLVFPAWLAYAIAAIYIVSWMMWRWRTIAPNVRKFSFKGKRRKSLGTWELIRTYSWVFLMPGNGNPKAWATSSSGRARSNNDYSGSSSYSSSDSGSSSSSSDSGGGGSSGGGGASDSW